MLIGRINMSFRTCLNLLGLFIGFIGSVIITLDLFISKKQAIELGVSRWAGDTEEGNLRLPQVQQLLKQSRHAKLGFGLITLGFLLQILGSLPF